MYDVRGFARTLDHLISATSKLRRQTRVTLESNSDRFVVDVSNTDRWEYPITPPTEYRVHRLAGSASARASKAPCLERSMKPRSRSRARHVCTSAIWELLLQDDTSSVRYRVESRHY